VKVIIPTKGRSDTIRTHLLFKNYMKNVYILVHTDEEWNEYRRNESIDRRRLIVSGVPADAYGLTRQREWAVTNIVDEDEWFVFADDNIRELHAVPEPWYSEDVLPLPKSYSREWRLRYWTPCPADEFIDVICEGMAERAEAEGIKLCGFPACDNWFFRAIHWKYCCYIIGKMTVQKNTDLVYNHNISMEDFAQTARRLVRDGRVLMNNYARMHSGHYEKGGMGLYEERIAVRKKDCIKLMEMYPGLFRYKKLKGFVPGTDLALKVTEKTVDAWRQTMRKPVTLDVERTPAK